MDPALRSAPVVVRSSEAGALSIASAAMGLSPASAAGPALTGSAGTLALGSDALSVLASILASGAISSLVRGGGDTVRRSLTGAGGATKKGRLWERHRPPELQFSAATWALLRALCERPIHELSRAEPAASGLTPADELFYLGAADTCAALGLQRAVAAPVFTPSRLVRAAYPREQRAPLAAAEAASLLEGAGAIVLEGSRRRLAARVFAADVERRAEARADEAEAIACSFACGPRALAEAAVAAGRPDLGDFLLEGVERLLSARASAGPEHWSAGVPRGAALSARQRWVEGALAWLDGALLFQRVADRARSVGFVDDGYEAAQATLQLLEPWTQGGFERAAAARREVSSFALGSGIVAGRPDE